MPLKPSDYSQIAVPHGRQIDWDRHQHLDLNFPVGPAPIMSGGRATESIIAAMHNGPSTYKINIGNSCDDVLLEYRAPAYHGVVQPGNTALEVVYEKMEHVKNIIVGGMEFRCLKSTIYIGGAPLEILSPDYDYTYLDVSDWSHMRMFPTHITKDRSGVCRDPVTDEPMELKKIIGIRPVSGRMLSLSTEDGKKYLYEQHSDALNRYDCYIAESSSAPLGYYILLDIE